MRGNVRKMLDDFDESSRKIRRWSIQMSLNEDEILSNKHCFARYDLQIGKLSVESIIWR